MTYEELLNLNYHLMWLERIYYLSENNISSLRKIRESSENLFDRIRAIAIASDLRYFDCECHCHQRVASAYIACVQGITIICPYCRRQYYWNGKKGTGKTIYISDDLVKIPFVAFAPLPQTIDFNNESSWITRASGIWRTEKCAMAKIRMTTKEGRNFDIDQDIPYLVIRDWMNAKSVGSFWHKELKKYAKAT